MLGDNDLVHAVLEDYRSAPISDQEKALLAFIEKICLQSNQICQDDIDEVNAAGWSEDALYDAITVCSLFQFYNTWIDATGVGNMPDFAYAMSGKRLAYNGYVLEQDLKD